MWFKVFFNDIIIIDNVWSPDKGWRLCDNCEMLVREWFGINQVEIKETNVSWDNVEWKEEFTRCYFQEPW